MVYSSDSLSQTEAVIFEINYESGIYDLDLNYDGLIDKVVAGYHASGTAHSFIEFNLLLSNPPNFRTDQVYHSIAPFQSKLQELTTRSNADCQIRNIKFVKFPKDGEDYKLLVIERVNVPSGGHSESQVEFSVLKLNRGNTAGVPAFYYLDSAEVVSDNEYCSVNDAFDQEWASIYVALSNQLLSSK